MNQWSADIEPEHFMKLHAPSLIERPCRTERRDKHSIGNEAVAVCKRSVEEATAECRHAWLTQW
jgi:hypothetical protein